ncbi:Zinc finger C2H2-type protein [Macrophomina phaseolina MS6]|uniref:Zinc finger C2H2-type protein n=1 Tax=Macrophomina phaseolina (strain MS6) TaxID=1126212 RepID=K2RHB5_MACPH|nr:Zinc finger C2H2-type protein [Macrophomina phaseolina MS6]
MEILRKHQAETGHCFCSHCNVHFSNASQHLKHVRNVSHPTQYSCCDCGRDYPSDSYLERHCCQCDQVYRSRARLRRHFKSCPNHRPRPQIARVEDPASLQHKCAKCDEKFATKKALKAHKRVHKPPRIIPCPTGDSCQKKFATPSALLNHLESGKCPSGLTRARLNAMVISNDTEGHIVDHAAIEDVAAPSSRLVGDRAFGLAAREEADIETSEQSSSGSLILTPMTNETSDEVIQDLGQTGAGTPSSTLIELTRIRSRVCPLCPDRRPFRTAAALEAHVNSAAHAPKIFHCPLIPIKDLPPGTKEVKIKSFSTLSGLAQHLETGVCRGGLATFRRAFEYAEEKLAALGLGNIKLLFG